MGDYVQTVKTTNLKFFIQDNARQKYMDEKSISVFDRAAEALH